jgi:rhamnosyltransferase
MEVSKNNQSVAAVIVTYQPDLKALNDELLLLAPQVDGLVVVDNGSANVQDLRQLLLPFGAHLESLSANTGIAHAQNVGIALAKQRDVGYVLLMDQDSVPDAAMVAQLKQVMDDLVHQGQQVAAVGPRYIDGRYDEMPCFNRVTGLRMMRLGCNVPASVIEADYLIASGSLISMAVLGHVGKMADDLFIDYIDIEWGLRARAAGYKSYGVCAARLEHSLGENPIRFLGRYISVHNPIRNYYFVRNALLVYRQPYVRWNWVIADFENVLKLLLKACIVGPDRWRRLKYMLLGGWHGLLNRSGPMPDRWLTRQ